MRIAQVAPLAERCPPRLYGGTERIVSYLTEELVRQGHDVTLFASGDSRTSAKLVRCSDMALRLNPAVKDHTPYHLVMLDEVRRRADDFDVIHFHIDLLHFPLIRDYADRTLTTLHGRLDLPDLKPFYAAFPEVPLVSISESQRYWDTVIAPLIARHANVEFVGEINEAQKASFLGNARALLVPIDWPEPFGLVTIEAMACGTPVIAWNCGAVPEIVDDGVTGFIVDNEAEAVTAVKRLAMLDRARVRSVFERRFTVERMAQDYLSAYRSLAGVQRDAARLRRAAGNGRSLHAVDIVRGTATAARH
jgi:glycosyltransferase involved in cell wall biosynthesis